jgi:hypothetical protein
VPLRSKLAMLFDQQGCRFLGQPDLLYQDHLQVLLATVGEITWFSTAKKLVRYGRP